MKSLSIIKAYAKIIGQYFKSYIKYLCADSYLGVDASHRYAFVFFAADYDNLGDIAITVAQERFLKNCLPSDICIVKIKTADTYAAIKAIKKLPTDNVLITLIGGGNHGSLYDFIEVPRRYLLIALKKYRIISFPQTAVFTENPKGIADCHAFKYCCVHGENMVFTAREKLTFSIYNNVTAANVILTPDIVFTLDYAGNSVRPNSNSAALILRDDKEKSLDIHLQENLIDKIKRQYNQVYFWDTCDVCYEPDNSVNLLNDFANKLKTVDLVITDRLHGMILCYITATPCIVLDNNNGKIRATFETWLQGQNFIKLYDPSEKETLEELIDGLRHLECIKKKNLQTNFNPLKKIVLEAYSPCRKLK